MTKATIKISGKQYEGWKRTTVRRSIETISSVFSFDFTDSWTPLNKPWGVNPQDAIDIEIGATRLIRGYAEVLNANLGSERSYTVQGRDKSCDLIDCSAVVKQYKNISLLDLCNALSSVVGITFKLQDSSINNAPFPDFAVNPGEKIFECIDKLVRQRGVLCIPDGSGNVVLSLAGTVPALAALTEGVNCKTLSYTLDYSQRYSDYTVKGQDTGPQGYFGTATSVKGTAKDLGVKRMRPLIIQAEKTTNSGEAKVRAAWEANVRAGRSTTVNVEVQDWLQAPGRPWLINETVTLNAPKLGIGGKFLIAETEYIQEESGGTICKMKLMPPDAFLSDPNVKKKKSDQVAKGWTF